MFSPSSLTLISGPVARRAGARHGRPVLRDQDRHDVLAVLGPAEAGDRRGQNRSVPGDAPRTRPLETSAT